MGRKQERMEFPSISTLMCKVCTILPVHYTISKAKFNIHNRTATLVTE